MQNQVDNELLYYILAVMQYISEIRWQITALIFGWDYQILHLNGDAVRHTSWQKVRVRHVQRFVAFFDSCWDAVKFSLEAKDCFSGFVIRVITFWKIAKEFLKKKKRKKKDLLAMPERDAFGNIELCFN